MELTPYVRPHATTANPAWAWANCAADLVPTTDDPLGEGARMWRLCGNFIITQGPLAGRRLEEVPTSWQGPAVRYIFGQRDAAGAKEVRRVLLKLGKGSGKSATAAAIALAVIMASAIRRTHMRALVVVVAADVASANIVFQHAFEAINADPELNTQFLSHVQSRTVTHVASGISMRVLAPELRAAVGLRPLLTIVDELHLAALLAPDFGRVLDQLRKGSANWGADALEIDITTAPPERASGAYRETLGYARRVRDGKVVDRTFLPLLFEWPVRQRPDLNLHDPAQWWRGMPSLGYTMDASELERELVEAVNASEGESLSLLLSQRMGIEPDDRAELAGGETVLRTRWPDVATRSRELPERFEGLLVATVDAGGADDPQALTLLWKDPAGVVHVIVEQHLVRDGYERARQPGAARKATGEDEASAAGMSDLLKLYDAAIEAGELQVHDSFAAMDMAIGARIAEAAGRAYGDVVMGGDQYGRGGVGTALTEATGLPFEAISQGWKLGAAMATAEALLVDGALRVARGPLLDANVRNLVVEETKTGALRFRKADAGLSGQGASKIDGVMCMLSALALQAQRLAERPSANLAAMVG